MLVVNMIVVDVEISVISLTYNSWWPCLESSCRREGMVYGTQGWFVSKYHLLFVEKNKNKQGEKKNPPHECTCTNKNPLLPMWHYATEFLAHL